MKKYLSHVSAAYYWNIPYLDKVLDNKLVRRYKEDNVLDITYTDRNTKYQRKGFITHVCELSLPSGAVIKRGERFIASPELVFLEMANILDIHRLILLGIQLCSYPNGNVAKVITTKRKLTTFIGKMHGHYGQSNAERALGYIENGSYSIMESIVFMILTLPNSYGGYGLKGARFNYEILLNKNGRLQVKQKRCYVDLFYKESKVAVEYDSNSEHSTDYARNKDNIRGTALENQGITVLSLVTNQFYNEDTCKAFALKLSAHLGKRMRIRAKNFSKMHKRLRSMFPRLS